MAIMRATRREKLENERMRKFGNEKMRKWSVRLY